MFSAGSWSAAAFLQEKRATSEHRMILWLWQLWACRLWYQLRTLTLHPLHLSGCKWRGCKRSVASVVLHHSYLPTSFGQLTENALVNIAGFVVRKVMRQLSCDVCLNSLVCEAVPASFCDSYHLLTLKNNGGQLIPSIGTVKVIRAAEHCIRRSTNTSSAAHQCTVFGKPCC